MELEDALTIFSYSSPYPVQLSLLPATTSSSSAPRTPLGRRSWSLDQLDARRRQRRHSEVKWQHPARRYHSEARRPRHDVTQLCDAENSDLEHHPKKLVHASVELPYDVGQLSDCTVRPVAVHKTASSPCDRPTQSSVNEHELDCTRVTTSTDEILAVTQQLATVTASSTITPRTRDVAADTMTANSPGVASSSSNTIVAVSLDDERNRGDRDDALGDKTADQQASASAVEHQPTSIELATATDSRQTSVDLDSEVFYDIDLDDDDDDSKHDTTNITRYRPASKKKRSLIGSLKALVRSRSAGSNRNKRTSSMIGGAVAYVPPDEDMTRNSTSGIHVATDQDRDKSNSVRHDEESGPDGQHRTTDTSSDEFLAPKSNEMPSTEIDEVLTAASNTEARAANVSDFHQHCGPGQSEVELEEPQARTSADDMHHKQPHVGQSEVKKIKLMTRDARNSPSARCEEATSTKNLEERTGADDSVKERAVGQSKLADGETLVVSHDEVERVTMTARQDGVRQTVSRHEDSTAVNQRCAVSLRERANIQSPPPLLRADQDDTRTHTDVETTTSNSAFANTQTSNAGLTTDKDDVSMTRDGCEPLATEAHFDAVARTSGVDSDSLALQMFDEGHCRENKNLNSVEGVSDEEDEEDGMLPADAESPRRPARLDSQHLDVNYDEFRHSGIIQVTEPAVSAATADVRETATTARRQVVKDKRSPENDINDATTDIPSVLTMMLNVFGVRDEPVKPTYDHASSGHCLVVMETPTTTSGGTELSPVNDDVMRSHVRAAETDRTNTKIDFIHKDEVEHKGADSVLDRHNEQCAPAQNHYLSAGDDLHAHDYLHLTASDSRVDTIETAVDKNSAEYFLTTASSDKELNVNESRPSSNSETDNTSDSAFQSHGDVDFPDKCQHGDRPEADCAAPIVGENCARNSPQVMGQSRLSSSGIVGGGGVQQTVEKFYDRQLTRPHYDSAQVAGVCNVQGSRNRISNDQTDQRPYFIGVPLIRGNQLPTNSPEGTSPTTEHLNRNTAACPADSDYTFVVRRQVKVSNNYVRSLSTGSSNNTGSSNGGNVSEEPAYTFVVPVVRRRSASDYNNNDLSAIRRFSSPQTVSDGRKSDIHNRTVTTPRYTEMYSSKYNSQHVVDVTVHHAVTHGPRPVRTGSGNTFDRKQTNSFGYSAQQPTMIGRLSESMRELRVSGVGDCGPPSQTCANSLTVDSVKDETVSGRQSDHVTCSTSSGVDDFCPDVTASCDTRDVKDNNADDDRGHDWTWLRVEPVDVGGLDVGSESAMPVGEESGQPRVSRLTVQLANSSGGSSAQQVNSRRRPRRRRIVCLPHSALTSSTTSDVTSPTLTTHRAQPVTDE